MIAPFRVAALAFVIGVGVPARAPFAQSAPTHAATATEVDGSCFTRPHEILNTSAEGLSVQSARSAAPATGGTPLHTNDALTSNEDIRCSDDSTAQVTYTISGHTHLFKTVAWMMVGNASRGPHETEDRDRLARIAYLQPDSAELDDQTTTMVATANSTTTTANGVSIAGYGDVYLFNPGVASFPTITLYSPVIRAAEYLRPEPNSATQRHLYLTEAIDPPNIGGVPTVGVWAFDLPESNQPVGQLTFLSPKPEFNAVFSSSKKSHHCSMFGSC